MRIWAHLLKKSLTENTVLCTVNTTMDNKPEKLNVKAEKKDGENFQLFI